ncbi:hypothetical protein [Polaribacter sp.]|uniref:hypothetical protein n=1 Tax=Polaribacter sp. TaxID=1920175 RepID=UPI003F6ABFCE
MKKKYTYFLIFVIPFFVFWNVNWVNKIEQKVKSFQRKAVQISVKNVFISNINSEIKVFKNDNKKKLQVTYYVEKYMDVKQEFFKDDRYMFANIEKGITPLLYKRKRKSTEPYGQIFEKIVYFKNKNIGIEKYRELPVYGNEDYQSLKLELLKKDFSIKNIGLKEYLQIEDKYKEIDKR